MRQQPHPFGHWRAHFSCAHKCARPSTAYADQIWSEASQHGKTPTPETETDRDPPWRLPGPCLAAPLLTRAKETTTKAGTFPLQRTVEIIGGSASVLEGLPFPRRSHELSMHARFVESRVQSCEAVGPWRFPAEASEREVVCLQTQ